MVQARPRLSTPPNDLQSAVSSCTASVRTPGCTASIAPPLAASVAPPLAQQAVGTAHSSRESSACVPPALGSAASSRESSICPAPLTKPEAPRLVRCRSMVSTCTHEDHPLSVSSSFGVEELHYDTMQFDPASPKCKLQLTSKLGLAQNARIESFKGHCGGMNQGIWSLCDSAHSLMLKLVKSQRHHPMVQTEAENFQKLAKDYPGLVQDRDFTFPLKIFRCHGQAGHNTHDLIAMSKAPGQCFTDVINRKMQSRQVAELMQAFEGLGSFLANAHNKYGLQHGDFQPSNIFYDEASGHFTMIDIADLALHDARYGVQESDVEHFCTGVRLLARCHGEHMHCEGVRRFKAGYAKRRQV